jgi:CIC family chloride channel protein
MAAVFAAAAEAPITAIVIVFEMSDDYTIILPLMVAVVIATLLGRSLLGATVYERKLIRRGIDWQQARHPRFFSKLAVSSVARTPPAIAQPGDTIASVLARESESGELAIPVCDGERFVGVVTSLDLARAAVSEGREGSVGAIVRATPERLRPGDMLERAATLMADSQTPLLPVLDADDKLVGIVTRRDLLEAYRSSAGT